MGLVSIPLTIHYLGSERFGLWVTISAAVNMLQFADLGIGNGLLNEIAESRGCDDNEKVKIYISSGAVVLGCISIFLICLFFFLNSFINWAVIFNAKSPLAISEASLTTAVLVIIFSINIAMGVITKANLGLQSGYAKWNMANFRQPSRPCCLDNFNKI